MISADTLDTNLVARQSSLFLCCCLCVWGGSGLVSVWTCSGIGFSVTNGGPFRALLTLPPSCHVHSVSQVPPCDWLIWTSVPNQTVQCPYWSVPCAPFFVDQTSPPVAAETRVESSPPLSSQAIRERGISVHLLSPLPFGLAPPTLNRRQYSANFSAHEHGRRHAARALGRRAGRGRGPARLGEGDGARHGEPRAHAQPLHPRGRRAAAQGPRGARVRRAPLARALLQLARGGRGGRGRARAGRGRRGRALAPQELLVLGAGAAARPRARRAKTKTERRTRPSARRRCPRSTWPARRPWTCRSCRTTARSWASRRWRWCSPRARCPPPRWTRCPRACS